MSDRPDAARRSVLTGAFLTKQGRQKFRPLGPLPPWHKKIEHACSTCLQDCVSACPQSIIKLHPDDHQLEGIPYLDFSRAGCTFCGECVKACAQLTEQEDSKPDIGMVKINAGTCLALNGVLCMSCLRPCEPHALSLNKRRQPVVNEDTCTGCGACISVCPVNALYIEISA
ncbi:MAG: 4Fe-4S dicluster domain-containing protein [Gammaproteobacteria bacterium]|nr:MAG: 4Fe-4S dicluster domain-containing protein [Gammaproteobacteria bacterium]